MSFSFCVKTNQSLRWLQRTCTAIPALQLCRAPPIWSTVPNYLSCFCHPEETRLDALHALVQSCRAEASWSYPSFAVVVRFAGWCYECWDGDDWLQSLLRAWQERPQLFPSDVGSEDITSCSSHDLHPLLASLPAAQCQLKVMPRSSVCPRASHMGRVDEEQECFAKQHSNCAAQLPCSYCFALWPMQIRLPFYGSVGVEIEGTAKSCLLVSRDLRASRVEQEQRQA